MSEGHELRVLFWNIHSWLDEQGNSNVERVAELIAHVDPEIVALVEVDESLIEPAEIGSVAARNSYRSVFVPAFDYGDDRPTGQFGNAILTKIPILGVRHNQLRWPPVNYAGTEPSEPRSVTWVCVAVADSAPVWVGCTHLPRSDAKAREQTRTELLSRATALPKPWLLVGDFNEPAEEWIDAYPTLRAHPTKPTPTYPTSQPTECIDYCVSPADQHIDVTVLTASGSDHLPLLLRLRPGNDGTGNDTPAG